ncbi:hypothetical protein F5Y05DRAFT_363518 [Hypoxylon sp. FL0543]|nr:hypothetical protein F5Y05DRAFT_363518 [Hypoxylon sp. FL0543]
MAKRILTVLFVYVAFMALTGLYGFVRFSRQGYHEIKVDLSVNSEGAVYTAPTPTPTVASPHDLGLKEEHSVPVTVRDDSHVYPTIIIYSYTETPSARENLIFFLENGLHGGADFVFVLNGPSSASELIPGKANVQVMEQPIECSDLGAYGEVLRKDGLWKKYSRFIMLSSSVVGPFTPFSSRRCWTDAFLSRVTKDVKLVGITATCLPEFHIQSTALATDLTGMKLVLNALSVNNQALEAEIAATAAIKAAGHKVDALMKAFRRPEDYEEDCAKNATEDAFWDEKRHDTYIGPYETLFLEANQTIGPYTIAQLAEWPQSPPSNGSWDVCAH